MIENENNNIGGIVNSEPTMANNKKGPNIVLIIVFIIFAIGMGVGGFVLGTKFDNDKNDTKVETPATDENGNEIQNDEEKPAKNEKYTFLEEQTTEIEYSGTKHKVVMYYYLDKTEEKNSNDETIVLYSLIRDLFIDGNKIIDAENYLVSENEIGKQDIKPISDFKYRLLKDTNGKDEYAIIDGREDSFNVYMMNGGFSDFAYIVDKEGKNILKIETQIAYSYVDGIKITEDNLSDRDYIITDGGYTLYYNGLMDLHSNYFYYIVEPSVEDPDYWQEYKVTISDGNVQKIESTKYKYDVVLCSGQC